MSTCLFSARLVAGQVTTSFAYSRGLNGALVANPFNTPEMRIKQAVSSTRGIIERRRANKWGPAELGPEAEHSAEST